jgi:outer membrane biosynthesis protein TonB
MSSLGTSARLYAQDEKPQENKPKQQEPKKQEEPKKQDEAKPANPQDEKQPARQESQENKKQDEAKPANPQDEKQPARQENQEKRTQPQDEKQAQSHENMERGQQAANAGPAGKGGRIPDDKFRAHFGRPHAFRAQTVIVASQPRFSYSGYTFELVDAWPSDWAYTDDCYIDYIDGEYFLFDLLHPGVRIALIVVL